MSVDFTMAESERKVYEVHKNELQETESKNSNVKSPGAFSPVKNLVRRFSIIKTRENEEPETKDNNSTNNDKSFSSERKEAGLFERLSSIRKSLTRKEKKCTSIKENVAEDSIIKREDSNDSTGYNFDNIPKTPLAAMQINELIQKHILEEAYENLLSMRLEVQREQKALDEKVMPGELTNKEKDLNLLFNNLSEQLAEIVRKSCIDPSYNKELLRLVAAIMLKEENNEGKIRGLTVWRAAIQDGIREVLSEVRSHEQNVTCVAVHLEHLGKKIVEHLKKAKTEFVNLYPSEFKVFETYVLSCNKFVEEHLTDLLKILTEFKDFNSLLNFVDDYQSEKILGSSSLQPEMKEIKSLRLSENLLDQIRKRYVECLKIDLHESLENIVNTECETVWKKKEQPRTTEDGKYWITQVHKDVSSMINKYVKSCGKTDENLKKNVACKCIEALNDFPKRFQKEFLMQKSSFLGSDLLDCVLWAKYHIAYINSFSFLTEDMESYKDKCPNEVKQLETELDNVVFQLRQALLELFKTEVGPFIGKLMTKEWLNTDADFNELTNRIESYSGFCKSMKLSPANAFANDVHYHVVKGYISELLKNKYSCKGRKNDMAAAKIREQYDGLNKLFREMGSTFEWLYPLGDQLSVIIEQEHEKDIKKHLPPLVENYPDISKKQFSAILSFRDSGFHFSSQAVQHFTDLKQNVKMHKHQFFSDIK